jgi:hypothetical protein
LTVADLLPALISAGGEVLRTGHGDFGDARIDDRPVVDPVIRLRVFTKSSRPRELHVSRTSK